MINANISVRLDEISRRTGLIADRTRGLAFAIAEWLRLVIRTSFQEDSSPEGIPWQPWSPKYAARGHGKGMLEKSGALFEQVTRTATIKGRGSYEKFASAGIIQEDTITFGSSLPYAAAHQFGFEGDVSVHEFFRQIRQPGRDVWGKILGKNNKIVRGKIMMGVAFPKTGAHTRHMRIPARPFLPTPAFAESEGAKIAQEYVDHAAAEASS